MEENLPEHPVPDNPPPYRPPELRVRMVLGVQVLLFILCTGVFQMIALLAGWDTAPTLTADSPPSDRWQARLELGGAHLFGFTVSGLLTVWLFYRNITGIGPGWPDYLRMRQLPRLKIAALAILLMAASIPFVLYVLHLNQMIPFPETIKVAEEQTEAMLSGLLTMDNVGELLANLTIIALLPAIGEEIVFRGVIQQQLMRRIADPWTALAASAVIFSFFHFQFEGFLARLLLGFLLGWLYWKTQNFWVPALAHFFNNALQIVGQYLYGKEVSAIDLEQDIEVPWFAAAISAIMVFATMRLIGATMDGKDQPAPTPQEGG